MAVRHTPNDITVLDDCYNASPESVHSALRTLDRMSASHVAVLGDMRELGDYAEEAHMLLGGSIVYHYTIRLLVTVGNMAAWIADSAEKRRHTAVNFQSVRFKMRRKQRHISKNW